MAGMTDGQTYSYKFRINITIAWTLQRCFVLMCTHWTCKILWYAFKQQYSLTTQCKTDQSFITPADKSTNALPDCISIPHVLQRIYTIYHTSGGDNDVFIIEVTERHVCTFQMIR